MQSGPFISHGKLKPLTGMGAGSPPCPPGDAAAEPTPSLHCQTPVSSQVRLCLLFKQRIETELSSTICLPFPWEICAGGMQILFLRRYFFFLPCVLSAATVSYCVGSGSELRGSFQPFCVIFSKINWSCIIFEVLKDILGEKLLLVPLALDLFHYSSVLNQEDKSRFISPRNGRIVVPTIAKITRGKM